MKFILGICVLSVLNWGATASLFSWVFGQKNAPDSHGNESPDGGGISTSYQGAANLGKPVPFEMKSAESRFLKAGEEYMAGLSVLDTCHHRVSYFTLLHESGRKQSILLHNFFTVFKELKL